MMRVLRRSSIVVCLILWIPVFGRAQSAADDSLRRDIEALKKGQEAIQRDLEEIKRLLIKQQQAPQAPAALPRTVDIDKEPVRGNQAARVAIIEYSDYQCPFCSRFVLQTLPRLENEYIKTGKVRYVFRDLPLNFHKQAFKAAEATHCAGEQGRFWEMHDRLFANQKALMPAQLTEHAQALGLDVTSFQQCLDSSRFADAIRKDVTEANSAGITGTPSFLIGVVQPNSSSVKIVRKLVGARSFEEFKTELDALLAAPAGTN